MTVIVFHVEHTLTILACLAKHTKEEAQQQRLLYKFMDNDYEKLHLLLIKRLHYSIIDGESYVERLDNGLIQLQMIDVTLVFLMNWSDDIFLVLPKFLRELDFEVRDVLESVKGNSI
jgi:hypothetical protein